MDVIPDTGGDLQEFSSKLMEFTPARAVLHISQLLVDSKPKKKVLENPGRSKIIDVIKNPMSGIKKFFN